MTLPPLSRPLQRLEREKREIATFLRVSIDQDEAEAMASSGYRFLPCGGCGKLDCDPCNREPTDQVRVGSRGKAAQRDPRHVRAVVQRCSLFPQYLYVGVPRELNRLEPDERVVLLLDCGAGLDQDVIARRLKVSRSTVLRLKERGLTMIALGVWDDEGAPRYDASA